MYKTKFQDIVIQKVKRLRLERHLSQAELGVILGLSSGHISNIESPNFPHKYSLKHLKVFCDYIGYDMVNLFIEDETEYNVQTIIDKLISYDERKSEFDCR